MSGPLSFEQRLAATLFFDTQPARRAAYLKQLGYTLDPKDHNKYKDKDGETYEIDPGGWLNAKQYFKEGGSKEFGADLIEGVLDFFSGASTEAAGQATGLAAAGVATAPSLGTATFPAYAVGRGVGRATAYQAIEAMKDKIGDQILNENVPVDDALRLTQTAIQSIAPEAISAGGSALKKAASNTFSYAAEGFKKIMGAGGGKINQTAWDWLKERVRTKTMPPSESFQNARSSLDQQADSLLGTSANSNKPDFSKSVFQRKMNPLEEARKQEAAALSANPETSLTTKEILAPLMTTLEKLNMVKGKSEQTLSQISWIKGKINQLKKDFKSGSGSFSDVDGLVKELQKDIYNPTNGRVWRDGIKPVVEQLNETLKKKATAVGSPYASIKEQEAKLFRAFDSVEENINKDKLARTIIGGEKQGTKFDTDTESVMKTMDLVDDALGTKGTPQSLTNAIQTDQVQRHLFTQMEALGRPSGSGGFLKAGSIAASPAIVASAYGMPGAKETAAAMFVAGGLASSPKIAIPAAVAAETAANKIKEFGTSEAAQAAAPYVSSAVSRELVGAVQPKKEEEKNPFLDGLDEPTQSTQAQAGNPFLEGL